MHCASCASNIENALKKVSGVLSSKLSFAAEKAFIEFDPAKLSVRELMAVIDKAGYKALIPDVSLDKEEERRNKEVRSLRIRFIAAISLSSVLMFICMAPCAGIMMHGFIMDNMALVQFLLATAVLACGYQFFTRGFRSMLKRQANMDTLVALGVGSAYLYSLVVSIAIWSGNKTLGMEDLYYEVAAFLISFIMLGKYLEARTKRKTSYAIKKLMGLRPKSAIVIRAGVEREIPVEELIVGDIIVVKPGERIPVDGKVTEGYSSLDESMVTGESIPVEKNINDAVIGGTINKSGSFKFKAAKVGKETALARIIKLIEEAQGSKAPVQELADKIAAIFVPAVLIIAFSSLFIWLLLGKSFIFALTAFITVLIIACPCSLGLATPTAVMVGTGIAAENGIIIKNAASLQMAKEVKAIIFDKTGTLTNGKPAVTHLVSYTGDESEVLRLSASLEKKSEHPLADAIVNFSNSKGLSLVEISGFESVSGKGVMGIFENKEILLGNRRFMSDYSVDIRIAGGDLDKFESEGRTIMMLAKERQLIGLIAARDELKDFSKDAVRKLKSMGKAIIMLTGDNKRTAQAIAKECGIGKALAEVLPQDKVGEIKKMQAESLKVAFVGDGINDAPALTQADLGIAIGTGTDIAIDSGDIILIKDDLRDVVTAIDLSHYAMKKIKQNLFWAFFYNSVGIPIAAGLLYPFTGYLLSPIIAGTAMAFSSVSVVANSLLMRRYKSVI